MMTEYLRRYQSAFQDLPAGVLAAEAVLDSREQLVLEIADGRVENAQSFEQAQLHVRVSGVNTSATVYSEDPQEEPAVLIQKAWENACRTPGKKAAVLHRGPSVRIREASEIRKDELLAFGRALEETALAHPDVDSVEQCMVRKTCKVNAAVNSLGLDSIQESSFYLVRLELSLKGRKKPEGAASICVKALEEADVKKIVERAVERAKRVPQDLPAADVKAGRYDAVLSAEAACEMMFSMWRIFSADQIRKPVHFLSLPEKKPLGSSAFTVLDAPSVPGWAYEIAFDCEGVSCGTKTIVREGVFETPLSTLSAADILPQGVDAGGNAGRVDTYCSSLPIDAVVVPRNIYIQPGKMRESQLVDGLENGLYITYVNDSLHGVDLSSGNYSFPCGGMLIRDGKPAGRVDQLILTGNLRGFFASIRECGSELRMEEFDLGENYCYGAPALRVDDLYFSA